MTLASAIAAWDGKSADDIESVGEAHSGAATYLSELVEHAVREDLQRGATWLLLAALRGGRKLSEAQERALLSDLSPIQDWETRLHVLQSLPYLTIPPGLPATG